MDNFGPNAVYLGLTRRAGYLNSSGLGALLVISGFRGGMMKHYMFSDNCRYTG